MKIIENIKEFTTKDARYIKKVDWDYADSLGETVHDACMNAIKKHPRAKDIYVVSKPADNGTGVYYVQSNLTVNKLSDKVILRLKGYRRAIA